MSNYEGQRREGRESRELRNDPRDFNRALRGLKKDFQKNVLPAMKRQRYFLSKSERRREKERRAARRLRRQQRKADRFQ